MKRKAEDYSISGLKKLARTYGADISGCLERNEMIAVLKREDVIGADGTVMDPPSSPPPTSDNNNTISMDEQVTIRVGGGGGGSPVKTYQHTKLFLVHSSDYFDAMFRCQMKETKDGVIEFPDDIPAHWELIQPFLELGMKQPAVTTDNVFKLLLWNEKLLMKHDRVKGACSEMLSEKVKEATDYLDEERTNMVIFILKLGYRFHLDDVVTLTRNSLEYRLGSEGAYYFLRGLGEMHEGRIELKKTRTWERKR